MALFHSGICYFCFDNLLCIMNVHVAGQFRILQKRLECMCDVLNDDLNDYPDSFRKVSLNSDYDAVPSKNANCSAEYARFKECVHDHQKLINFTKMVEDVYTFVILSQVVIFSVLICLVTYQAVLVSRLYPNNNKNYSQKIMLQQYFQYNDCD